MRWNRTLNHGRRQQRDSSVLVSPIRRRSFFHTSTNQCTRSKLLAFDQRFPSVVRRDSSNDIFHKANIQQTGVCRIWRDSNFWWCVLLLLVVYACLCHVGCTVWQVDKHGWAKWRNGHLCLYSCRCQQRLSVRRVQPQIYGAALIVGRLIARRRPEKNICSTNAVKQTAIAFGGQRKRDCRVNALTNALLTR